MADNLPEKILIVDDDPSILKQVEHQLARYNVKVFGAKDLDSAMYLFNQQRFDVVCVENDFEPQPGLIIVQKWRNHDVEDKRHAGVILLLGNRNDRSPGEQRLISELRGIEMLIKPFTAVQLLPYLSRAKASKEKSMHFEELKQKTLKLGAKADKVDKAVGMVQKELPKIGVRGTEIIIDLYEQHERWQNALDVVEQVLTKDTNNVGLTHKRGDLLLKLGRAEEALAVMEKADKAAPDNLNRISSLSGMYLEAGEPDKAMDKMRKMIAFNPEQEDLKFDLFSQLYDYGYDSHAHTLCKETTSPIEVVRYYNNKGVALNKAGKTEAALMEYERCLQFYPNFKENYRILYNVALAQVGFKNKESYQLALRYLDKCLELKPDFEKATKIKAQVEKLLSGKPKAKKKTKEAS